MAPRPCSQQRVNGDGPGVQKPSNEDRKRSEWCKHKQQKEPSRSESLRNSPLQTTYRTAIRAYRPSRVVLDASYYRLRYRRPTVVTWHPSAEYRHQALTEKCAHTVQRNKEKGSRQKELRVTTRKTYPKAGTAEVETRIRRANSDDSMHHLTFQFPYLLRASPHITRIRLPHIPAWIQSRASFPKK
jgi:hypothetical protein